MQQSAYNTTTNNNPTNEAYIEQKGCQRWVFYSGGGDDDDGGDWVF